jgi:hypothetical protein
MDWVIESFIRGDTREKSRRKERYKESKKLYVCQTCDNVWEINVSNTCIRYQSFPTIGLERKDCRYCVKLRRNNDNRK